MKYFEVVPDLRTPYCYKIDSIKWEEDETEKFGLVSFAGDEESLPDFLIYKQDFFVSLALKNVIEMYTEHIAFDLVIFNNIQLQIQKEYYRINPPILDALGKSTSYFKNGWVDQVVLSREKIESYVIFKPKALKSKGFNDKHLYVHLDIVESTLRRGLWGMIFKEVLLEA